LNFLEKQNLQFKKTKAKRHTALDAVSVESWHNLKQNPPSKNLKKSRHPAPRCGVCRGLATFLN